MRALVLVGLVFFHASPAFGSQDDFHGSRSSARHSARSGPLTFSLLLAPLVRRARFPFGMRGPTAR
ncbi:hypothetical protein [Nonomuraea sp. NPDC049625]|uniref:hypothetical protein n=1 Tax=Nonomuraea sp. NPDC049625 TaxID=3155775 RepID=UPI0034155646